MFLILATQRAVIKAIGGGGGPREHVRGRSSAMVARASESRHATGGENGRSPTSATTPRARPATSSDGTRGRGRSPAGGRAFLLGKPPEELACMKRLVAARRPLRDWSASRTCRRWSWTTPGNTRTALPGTVPPARRERTTCGRGSPPPAARSPGTPPFPGPVPSREQCSREQYPGVPAGTAFPVIPGVPPEAVAVLMPLLASGRTSAAAAGLALGISKSAAHRYLRRCGTTATPRPPDPARPPGGG